MLLYFGCLVELLSKGYSYCAPLFPMISAEQLIKSNCSDKKENTRSLLL
jgi:hypothetical protein